MKTQKLNLEDFTVEKLSKKQQKIVRGGDNDKAPLPPPTDPGKGGGGNGNGSGNG